MTRLFACAAVLVAALAPRASGDICAGAESHGTVGPPLIVGPTCAPYVGPPLCRTTDIGVAPTYVVDVEVCAN